MTLAALCWASCSKQIRAGADTFPWLGQRRSWPPPAWYLPGYHSQQLTLLCPADLIAVAQAGDGICLNSHRTSTGSPATSPSNGSAESSANSTEIPRKRISGERR